MNAMTRPVPSIDTVLPARNRRVAGDSRIVGIVGMASDADDSNRQPSRVVSSCCGTIRRPDRPGVGDVYTAGPGNWAPASRPVRAVRGVNTGRRYDGVRGRKERRMAAAFSRMNRRASHLIAGWRTGLSRPVLILQAGNTLNYFGYGRSEERRVGKEC